jgi:putative PEP-CTERM system TPR-repeat lipoprotein
MHPFLPGLLLLVLTLSARAQESTLEEQSLTELKEAIRSDPSNINAYYYLARSYLGLRQAPIKSDAESLNQALKDSNELYEDALTRIADGDARAAIIQLMNAIKVDESNLAAYMLLAQTYTDMRIAKGAEFYLREALAHGADPGLVLVQLGQALLSQEKYEDVLSDLSLSGLSRHLKAQVRILHGKAFMGLREYQKAERILKEAVRGDDSVAGAQVELARLAMMRGETEDARQRLNLIETAGEFLPDYWLVRGELSRTSGNIEDAIAHYQSAINLQEDHILALHAIANLNLDVGRLAEARPFIAQVREFYPTDLRGILLELTLATRVKDEVTRQKIIEQADNLIASVDYVKLQDDPYNLIIIGTIHHLSGKLTKASALLHRYLEFAPSDLNALRLLVTAQLNLGKPAAAISILEQTSEYHKDNVVWLSLFGEALIRQKKYPQAIAYLDRIIQQNPDDQRTRLRRVTLNVTMGNHEIALQELESLRQDNKDPAIGIRKANILLALGRFAPVLALVEELVMSYGNSAALYNIAGNAYLGLGDLKQARNAFNYALMDDPESITATFNIATVELKEDNIEPARKRFLKILEINSSHVLSMVQLAGIAQREGNLRKAIEYLQNAVQIRPNVKNSLRLVNLLITDQRKQEARTALTSLRTEYPEDLSVMAAEAKWSTLNNNAERAKQLYVIMRNQAKVKGSVADLVAVARYQQAAGDPANAGLTLDEAQKLDEGNLFVLVTRAEFKAQEEEFGEMRSLAEKIIKLAPEQAIGYRLKGDSLDSLDQAEDALQAYESGLTATAGSVTLVLRYYAALRDHEGTANAVEFLENWVVETRAAEFTILRALAAGHADLGNTTKAIHLNEALLEGHLQDVSLLNNLALLYLKTGDERAKSYAEKAYDLDPKNFAVMDTLGWVLTNKGEVSLGIAMLRNAMARSANIPEIRYHYAVALHKSGQSKTALKELQGILAEGQPFSGVEDARSLYKQLANGA